MRKYAKLISIVLISFFLTSSITGCYGNFTLTKKLYNWNGTVGSKFVNSAVMWVCMIVPVYGIAGFIDFAILNVIQFWTGKNPMAMNEGEKETQMVNMDGKEYQVTATKNRFDVQSTQDEKIAVSLVYNEQTQSWIIMDRNDNEITVAQLDAENKNLLKLIYPDGQTLKVDL